MAALSNTDEGTKPLIFRSIVPTDGAADVVRCSGLRPVVTWTMLDARLGASRNDDRASLDKLSTEQRPSRLGFLFLATRVRSEKAESVGGL